MIASLTNIETKVLGWLHNKFKHNGTASLKTSTESRSCFACLRKHEVELENFPTEIKLENEEDIKNDGLVSELFLGFLAIGTLGGELLNTETPTPTIPSIFEDTTNEEQKITENELKLISSKLEALFDGEQEETANKTSARSSHASVITLSNYQTEDTNTEDQRHIPTCALLKYLFGSSLELKEAEMPIKKKNNSLGDLFKRNKGHSHREEIQEPSKKQAKKRDTTVFLKKMLKKIHSVSVTTKTPPGDASHGSLPIRKLPKVFKLVPRKVHPEGSMARKGLTKSCNKRFEESFCKSDYQSANQEMVINSTEIFSRRVKIDPPTANREHWIKTDTEFLVLEL
ncbi:hypothetical protein LIER_13729 [Lithospermum erythrorhizon]|uniref:Uncharacterized protein n=1 Tax=Lithospermum erythrorhizon TaxID=34254 RepID=A0AAV3PYH5_LITER